MVDSILHGVRLVNRYRLLLGTVMYIMGEVVVVVARKRGEWMMVVVRIEDTVMRLGTHTL